MWGYFGAVGTAVIVYSTYQFSSHAVRRAYLTSDKKRIGFQVHNVLGNAGMTYEVKLGLAKILSAAGVFSSGYVPIRVEGLKTNLVLDDKGVYYHDKELIRLLEEHKDGYIQPKHERSKKLTNTKK